MHTHDTHSTNNSCSCSVKIIVKHQDPISIIMKLTSLVYTELKHAQLKQHMEWLGISIFYMY